MNKFNAMFILSLIYATPIIIAALGGLFSERSGVVNIALEGIMTVGAFVAATLLPLTEMQLGTMSAWVAILVAAIVGALYSIIHAYISVDLKGDQIISGTALNMLSLGITIYLCQIIFKQQRTVSFRMGFIKSNVPLLKDIPIIGKLFFTNIYFTFYIAIALVIISYFLIYKTKFGLRLRACGEHPSAVDSLGVSVRKFRYTGVIISGFLAGLAGGIMVLTQDTQFSIGAIHGVGFIALATLIFGRWNPWGILLAGWFFGFSQIFAIYSNDFPVLNKLPQEFFYALPYVLTIIAMVIFSRKSVGPKAAGEPYDVSKR